MSPNRSALFLSTCFAVLLFALPAAATPPIAPAASGGGSNTNGVDDGYGGLKWTLDEGLIPEVVIGYRHADVSSNGDTLGGDVSFAFNLFDGFQPGKLRIKYLYGKDYLQGEAGGGYDFAHGFFAGISAQGPYSNIGVDYGFGENDSFSPYFMFNSLGIYDKPATSPLTCPPSFALHGNSCVAIPG